MRLEINPSTKFRRDYKRIKSRGYDLDLLEQVVNTLAEEKPLPPENKDHSLSGNWSGFRECHIQPNWLLIYRVREKELELLLMRTGTHSDLFRE